MLQCSQNQSQIRATQTGRRIKANNTTEMGFFENIDMDKLTDRCLICALYIIIWVGVILVNCRWLSSERKLFQKQYLLD